MTTFSAFQKNHQIAFDQQGMPTRKNERYKYADLSFMQDKTLQRASFRDKDDLYDAINQHRLRHSESALVVMVNGYHIPALSDLHKIPSDVVICSIENAFKEHTALIEPCLLTTEDTEFYPFANLNIANITDGLFIHVPPHKKLSTPIHLLSLSLGEDHFIGYPHHVILMGKESSVEIFDEYVSFSDRVYMNNAVFTISISEKASFRYCKMQQESTKAIHLGHIFVRQAANSESHFMNFSNGAIFSRDELQIKLMEQGSSCFTSGFYKTSKPKQYCDHHVDILHFSPHSQSDMLYKGILDQSSRAVFNGRLYIQKDAQHILAYQANHNLLLSDEAEVYSKPELEIYADDVKCKHGASTGQINQEALFYLRSRGISHEEALQILLDGFVKDVLTRVTHQGMRSRIEEVML